MTKKETISLSENNKYYCEIDMKTGEYTMFGYHVEHVIPEIQFYQPSSNQKKIDRFISDSKREITYYQINLSDNNYLVQYSDGEYITIEFQD